MWKPLNIQKTLALVLWGAFLLAFILGAIGLLVYENLTLENRARAMVQPYAQLVSVGIEASVTFEDNRRANEILQTLHASPQILEADILLSDGRILASFKRSPKNLGNNHSETVSSINIQNNTVVLRENLPGNALLRMSLDSNQLNAQFSRLRWLFAAGILMLLTVTFGQLAVLRRMIARPIATLTYAAEHVRTREDFHHRVPLTGTDEIARLGKSFNSMMDAIQEKQDLLLEAQQIACLGNWWHDLVTDEIFWSEESFRIAGRQEQPLTTETILSWLHPHDVQKLKSEIEKDQVEPEQGDLEFRMVHPDGQIRWVHNRWKTIANEQGSAIRRIGTHQDITQRKQAEETLRQLNRELRAISECNQVVVRATDEQTLVESICKVICEEGGHRMAWVGYQEEESQTLKAIAWAGFEDGYLKKIDLCRTPSKGNCCICHSAIQKGATQVINDYANDPHASAVRKEALERYYHSSIALPLRDNEHKTFGVLGIYSATTGAFSSEEQRLLEELAEDLAFGITTLRTRQEHDRAEEQIRIAATAFEAQEGIVITDVNQAILRTNHAFTEITGYTWPEIAGKSPSILKSDHHDREFFSSMWQCIQTQGAWQGEIWNQRKSGEDYPAWVNITAVTDASGHVTHYVGTITDITERKEAERKIEHLAFYDLLTELPNRRLFMDRLQQALLSSKRNQQMGAILFIDLDNFKILNDTYGHHTGDQLLVEVAQRLRSCTRGGDTISRLGGDEFLVILEDLDKNHVLATRQARDIAQKILDALNKPYELSGQIHHSTPSIGTTLYLGDEVSAIELVKQADIAMYQAKNDGRNTQRFFDPNMQESLAQRAQTEAAMRVGISTDQFVIHYQPQCNGHSNIIGFEALLRWEHPERGLVPPGSFIPLAEETGLILQLGKLVLVNACRQLASWSTQKAFVDFDIAVNVSALQFHQEGFVDTVKQALADTGAPASRLKLEITETLVLGDINDSVHKMQELKKLGLGFSIDDFGTGYSSLSYLTRLPLDQIKIDRSFIRKLPDSSSDAAVVQTILILAENLKLSVVAEGVENYEQLKFLDQLNCPIYQGFYFARPMDISVLEHWLEAKLQKKKEVLNPVN